MRSDRRASLELADVLSRGREVRQPTPGRMGILRGAAERCSCTDGDRASVAALGDRLALPASVVELVIRRACADKQAADFLDEARRRLALGITKQTTAELFRLARSLDLPAGLVRRAVAEARR